MPPALLTRLPRPRPKSFIIDEVPSRYMVETLPNPMPDPPPELPLGPMPSMDSTVEAMSPAIGATMAWITGRRTRERNRPSMYSAPFLPPAISASLSDWLAWSKALFHSSL